MCPSRGHLNLLLQHVHPALIVVTKFSDNRCKLGYHNPSGMRPTVSSFFFITIAEELFILLCSVRHQSFDTISYYKVPRYGGLNYSKLLFDNGCSFPTFVSGELTLVMSSGLICKTM